MDGSLTPKFQMQGYRVGMQHAFDLETAAIEDASPPRPSSTPDASSGSAGASSGKPARPGASSGKPGASSDSAASTRPGSAATPETLEQKP